MKRILVIGSGGSGKSTFARRLGDRLALQVIHLDSHYWRPGWVEPPKEVWLDQVRHLLARESWVMDGNYSGTLETRLEACDTVIFLDFPRLTCVWRVMRRAMKYRNVTRPDMAAGCPEQWTFEFLQWIWTYPKRSRPKIIARLAQLEAKSVFYLRSNKEVEQFLANNS